MINKVNLKKNGQLIVIAHCKDGCLAFTFVITEPLQDLSSVDVWYNNMEKIPLCLR
jgi:hypothetical protein